MTWSPWSGQAETLAPESRRVAWRDAVYLSVDPVWTPDDVYLGEVTIDAAVPPGEEYSSSASVELPSLFPGEYYFLVRANWQHEVFEATALLNNTGASADTITMDVPELTLGVPTTASLDATGDAKLFRVEVNGGESLHVELTGAAEVSQELFVKHGDAPTPYSFDARGIRPHSPDQVAGINRTQPGTHYVLVRGTEVPASSTFTLTASVVDFDIRQISPTQGSNKGQVTISLIGTAIEPGATVRMTDSDGTNHDTIRIYYDHNGLLSATFDLTGLPTGLADIVIANPGAETITLNDSFEVIGTAFDRITAGVQIPGLVRVGRTFEGIIEYANEGTNDVPAPILKVFATEALTDFGTDAGSLGTETLLLLGINPNGPPGVLPPGASGMIEFNGYGHTRGEEDVVLEVGEVNDNAIDWQLLESSLRPDGMDPDEWTALFNGIRELMGTTWREFHASLSTAATLLPPSRGANYLLKDVFSLIQDWAWAKSNTSVSGKLVDANGQGYGDVRLTLYDETNELLRETITLTDGTFLFPEVPAGTYELRSADVSLPSTSITASDADVAVDELKVAHGTILQGWVIDRATGSPLAGATLSATNEQGIAYFATTRSDGRFKINLLGEGTFTLLTAYADYVGEGRDVTVVQGSDQSNLTLSMHRSGVVRGSIIGLPQSPPAGSQAIAFGVADAGGGSADLAEDGSYTIVGLMPGEYFIDFSIPGYAAPRIDGVSVDAGQQVDVAEAVVVEGGNVSGTIRNSTTDATLGDVAVHLSSDAYPHRRLLTDTQGRFESASLLPGDYLVSTNPAGFLKSETTVTVTAGQSTPVEFDLIPAASVQGTVTRPGGQPLVNVVVSVADTAGVRSSTVTDESGFYRIDNVGTGDMVVAVGRDRHLVDRTVTTEPGVEVTADFEVDVKSVLTGQVFDSDGETPIEGATVHIYVDGYELLTAISGIDGTYEAMALRAGTYDLIASKADRSFAMQKSVEVVPRDEPQIIDFRAGDETLSGVVRDGASDEPLANALVELKQKAADEDYLFISRTRTNEFGEYSFSNLAAADYIVFVEPESLDLAIAAIRVSVEGSASTSEGEGENGTTGDVVVRKSYDVEVTLKDPVNGLYVVGKGNVEFVPVDVELDPNRYRLTDSSDISFSNGPFRGIPEGQYKLIAAGQTGYERFEKVVDIKADQANHFEETLTRGERFMSGVVVDNDGKPLSGVAVELIELSGYSYGVRTTAQMVSSISSKRDYCSRLIP